MSARVAAIALAGLGLALLFAGTVGAGELTPVERRIVSAVDRHAGESLALLERAVEQNSGTLNLAGVRAVGAMFRPPLEALGFGVRWVDGTPWRRAGHLVATRPGRKGAPRVLLVGHLDTVFEADSPFQHWEASGDTARGPGVIDMKGGDVIVLLALRALADAGELDRLEVTVVFTGDEEKSGSPLELARRDLVEAMRHSDVVLGFEDGDGDLRRAVIARRGSSGWTLRVSGTPAHSSQVFRPDIGPGAIFECARILQDMRDSLAAEPYLTFNPGLIVGGTTARLVAGESRGEAFGKSNVVAESTLVSGDLRALSPEQLEHAKGVLLRIAARHPEHTGAEFSFDEGYPPLAPTEANRRLLAAVDRASRDLGFGEVTAVDPMRAGAADVSFAGGLGLPVLDAMGLKGDGGHTVWEWADLRALPVQAKRAAVVLSRLGRGGLAASEAPR